MAVVFALVGMILFFWGGVLVLRGVNMFLCGKPRWLWKPTFNRGWAFILVGFIMFMVGGAGVDAAASTYQAQSGQDRSAIVVQYLCRLEDETW